MQKSICCFCRVVLAFLIGCAATTLGAFAQMAQPTVQVYPAPAGIPGSSQYTVQVQGAGKVFNSFVYLMQNPAFGGGLPQTGITYSSSRELDTAWTEFSANVPVTVRITNAKPFMSVRILPSSAHIVPVVQGNTVSFPLSSAGQRQVAVDFCYTSTVCNDTTDTDVSHPLLVFVDPIPAGPVAGALVAQPGLAVPPLGHQPMIYFGPGVYDLGQNPYVLDSNQTALLAGGSYVKGSFAIAAGATNVSIVGRGVLSGEEIPHSAAQPMINGPTMAGNSFVRGITIIQSNFYNIQLGGVNNIVSGVKVLAWLGNTDGVRAASPSSSPTGIGSTIEDCFFKVGDDSIKLFSSGLQVRGCTVWQLDNAAAFELGVNQFSDQSNILVQNCHVIRTENTFQTLSNAVFSSALGGNANLSNYTFDHIQVENSNFRLFKLQLIPNQYTKTTNDNLGSINNFTFRDIEVTDAQELPDLFESFDPAHRITNVTFQNVTEAGVSQPNPTITYNVNRRHLALAGTAFSGLLWRSQSNPQNFEISLFSGVPANPADSIDINQVNLPATMVVRSMGEFFGDGYASVVLYNSTTGAYGLWKEPVLTFAEPWSIQYIPFTTAGTNAPVQVDGDLAGVGDFNGDGYSDLVTWNAKTQTGKIVLMNGAQAMSQIPFQPAKPSTWKPAGFGDFNQTGYTDILLRDAGGNLEILYFGATGLVGSADFTPADLFYNTTNFYNTQYPKMSGQFDINWDIIAVRDFVGTGYAQILWTNPATNQVGLTTFRPTLPEVQSGQVFAQLPAHTQIQACSDFNGDGAADMLLRNTMTGQSTLWYAGFFGGNLYEPGPVLDPGLSLDYSIQVK